MRAQARHVQWFATLQQAQRSHHTDPRVQREKDNPVNPFETTLLTLTERVGKLESELGLLTNFVKTFVSGSTEPFVVRAEQQSGQGNPGTRHAAWLLGT